MFCLFKDLVNGSLVAVAALNDLKTKLDLVNAWTDHFTI